MTSDPKKWISQIKRHIETAADSAVIETSRDIATEFRQRTEGNRRQTREAIGFRKTGFASTTVGLFFSTQYTRNKNAYTYRHFQETWRTIRPTAIATLIRRFHQHLTGK